MSIQKLTARAAALLACAVVLTACNSDDDGDSSDTTPPPSSTAAATPTSDATTPAATPTATSSDTAGSGAGSGAATGTKLKSLLPTATSVPKGWKIDDSAAFDTGATVQSPTSALLPDDECSQALTNGGARTLTSDYSAAYAMTGLTDPNLGGSSVVFNSYQPGAADKQMAEVTALVKRCGTFNGKDASGKSVRTTVTAVPVSGVSGQSLDIKVQPAGNYVGSEIVLIRSGDVIMGVDQSDAAGKTAPLAPVAKQLAATLPLK